MSSTRQKSCVGCVRSKRKCDQGYPKCRRCVARKIDCEYVGRNASRTSSDSGTNDGAVSVFAELMEDSVPNSLQLQRSPPTAGGLTPYINDAILELGTDPFNLPDLPGNGLLSPAVLEDIMANQDPDDFEIIAADVVYQRPVEFTARRLAGIPKTFAETAQTMFIHRRLFQEKSPQALQDALSACALYSMKTKENQALVLRNVEHKAQQLVAGIDPFRISKNELLPALQALLLYQIIRLFDGDIRLRTQAEVDETTIMAWVKQLRLYMRPIAPSLPAAAGALMAPQDHMPDWLRWLSEESIRRTVITTLTVKAVYDFLKYGYDKISAGGLCFTAQAALWDAQSEYRWQIAYHERRRLEVRIAHWDEDMAEAAPDDVEELAVIIMASHRGLETTGAWLGKTLIARYDLE